MSDHFNDVLSCIFDHLPIVLRVSLVLTSAYSIVRDKLIKINDAMTLRITIHLLLFCQPCCHGIGLNTRLLQSLFLAYRSF